MTSHTIDEHAALLGEQIKSLRLRQNIDRATLALQAGCSLSALKNLESGKGSTLHTLIAVTRALGREEWLGTVAPVPTISPLSLLKTGHMRQRASSTPN